jgi:hypothetical protein
MMSTFDTTITDEEGAAIRAALAEIDRLTEENKQLRGQLATTATPPETPGDNTDPAAIRRAASAIHSRFMNYARPFAGFLSSVGERPEGLVIYCRRVPSTRELEECITIAQGVPLEFKVTGDMAPCTKDVEEAAPRDAKLFSVATTKNTHQYNYSCNGDRVSCPCARHRGKPGNVWEGK